MMFEVEEEEEEVHAVSIDSRSVIGCDMDFAAQRKDSSDTISDDFELDEDDAVDVETMFSYSMASPKRLRKRDVLIQLK